MEALCGALHPYADDMHLCVFLSIFSFLSILPLDSCAGCARKRTRLGAARQNALLMPQQSKQRYVHQGVPLLQSLLLLICHIPQPVLVLLLYLVLFT
uniref:Uncharacterized protein n=1 Tax=Arundo donax TaxID=35708 RepID=A0A0A9DNH2_ARUDO